MCIPKDHDIHCQCLDGYFGNPYVECLQGKLKKELQYPFPVINRTMIWNWRTSISFTFYCKVYTISITVHGCRSDNECNSNEACINGKCNSPCKCGPNAICEVIYHKPTCKCPHGYTGNPITGCNVPPNPCDPNPCGTNAFCELDNGNPICFCPKGLTGNPFKNCSKYPINI